MFLNEIIFLLPLFLIISEVYSKCEHSTTDDPFNKLSIQTRISTKTSTKDDPFNKLSTETRTMLSTEFSTTTIPYGTCISYTDYSHLYGSAFFAQGHLVEYVIKLSDVKNLQIFSNKLQVNGFTVSDIYGDVFSFGDVSNTGNTEDIINLENKEIVGINLHGEDKINGIQFLIYDLLDETYSWTRYIGNNYVLWIYGINIEEEVPLSKKPSDFKITKIYGKSDSHSIKTLRVKYTYNICNPPKNPHSLPPIPTITTTAFPVTTILTTVLPDIPFGSCLDLNGISKQFGIADLRSYLYFKEFNVNVADLSRITIYKTKKPVGISFYYKNGDITTVGTDFYKKNAINVDLENKIISSVNVIALDLVFSLNFLIYNPNTDKYSWTFGYDDLSSYFNVDARNNAPFSSNFQITWISGTAAPGFGISKMKFGYSYTQCNPAVPATTPNAEIATSTQALISTTPVIISTYYI